MARHEQTLAFALEVAKAGAQNDYPAEARIANYSVATTHARSAYEELQQRIAADQKDDAATRRVLAFWFIAFILLLWAEGRLIARFLIASMRRSLQIERASAERDLRRREVEARERELRLRNRELERLAGTDPLTGLPNRRALMTWLRRESERLAKAAKPLGVLMIDIDHFKWLNDDHGHAVGDEALRLVAQIIQRSVRGSDLAARYGGEEFVVLLPGAGPVDTAEVAEVIRESIADAKWEPGRLRVSVGAVSDVPELDGDALIRAADRALYDAKRGGRNQTVVAERVARPGTVSGRRN
jgi:diguanylate cyclase (GGDEF)-like protein